MKYILACFLLCGCGLQNQIDNLKTRTDKNEQSIDEINTRIKSLATSIDNNINLISFLSEQETNDVASILSQISSIQTSVVVQTTTLVTLQTNENITAFHDFCGNQPGVYNEVGMITTTGKIVVYFEAGSNRYLSILSDGDYITSDGTACYFSVTDGGTKIVNEHY
jgi:hypothetical protein